MQQRPTTYRPWPRGATARRRSPSIAFHPQILIGMPPITGGGYVIDAKRENIFLIGVEQHFLKDVKRPGSQGLFAQTLTGSGPQGWSRFNRADRTVQTLTERSHSNRNFAGLELPVTPAMSPRIKFLIAKNPGCLNLSRFNPAARMIQTLATRSLARPQGGRYICELLGRITNPVLSRHSPLVTRHRLMPTCKRGRGALEFRRNIGKIV